MYCFVIYLIDGIVFHSLTPYDPGSTYSPVLMFWFNMCATFSSRVPKIPFSNANDCRWRISEHRLKCQYRFDKNV